MGGTIYSFYCKSSSDEYLSKMKCFIQNKDVHWKTNDFIAILLANNFINVIT